MIFSFKIKPVISFILIIAVSFGISFCLYKATQVDASTRFDYTIVLDAGHGGRDAGCSGINTQAKESELNLKITKKLEKYLKNFGFNVILTRTTNDGLYSPNATNFKQSDMEKRTEIIKKNKGDLLLSIHLNSFPSISEKGAQAFYYEASTESKILADELQKQLVKNLPNARTNSNKGDYYILKCVDIPTAIVECGFLSCPEEEELLITESYQEKVAYAVFCGIVSYFGLANNIE